MPFGISKDRGFIFIKKKIGALSLNNHFIYDYFIRKPHLDSAVVMDKEKIF